jgi:hypothetical protein
VPNDPTEIGAIWFYALQITNNTGWIAAQTSECEVYAHEHS